MAFRVGDIVQLRYGGGPRMKVEKTTVSGGNEWVTCVWGANNECHNYFAAEMLQAVGGTGGTRPTTTPSRPAAARPAAATGGAAESSFWGRLMSWLRG